MVSIFAHLNNTALVPNFPPFAVPVPSHANIAPYSWETQPEDDDHYDYPVVEKYIRFVFAIRNVVDLLTIVPSLVQKYSQNSLGRANGVTSFLRVLRLLRLFKLVNRSVVIGDMIIIIFATLEESFPALGLIFLVSIIVAVFFGSLIYVLEMGVFTATVDYPNGVYLRRSTDGTQFEPSPFTSIPTSMYWVITTTTTGQ